VVAQEDEDEEEDDDAAGDADDEEGMDTVHAPYQLGHCGASMSKKYLEKVWYLLFAHALMYVLELWIITCHLLGFIMFCMCM